MKQIEQDMSDMSLILNDIEAVIHAIGDSSTQYNEDQLLNMLIGIKQLHQTRYDKLWQTWNYDQINNRI